MKIPNLKSTFIPGNLEIPSSSPFFHIILIFCNDSLSLKIVVIPNNKPSPMLPNVGVFFDITQKGVYDWVGKLRKTNGKSGKTIGKLRKTNSTPKTKKNKTQKKNITLLFHQQRHSDPMKSILFRDFFFGFPVKLH